MKRVALILGFFGCAGIVGLGTRFLVSPKKATLAYGIQPRDERGLTAIKGVRDIASGLVLFVVWLVAGRRAFGWALVAASVTPIGDMIIVLTRKGSPVTAFGVHGATAAALVASGLVLGQSRSEAQRTT